MKSLELLKKIEAWLSFNNEPSREETAKLRKSIKDHLTEQLLIQRVSNSLVADIRNKLSSPKNLCAMLKNREVEPFIGDDKRNKMVDFEIEQTLKSINYLSNL